jgi:hypothetical protein
MNGSSSLFRHSRRPLNPQSEIDGKTSIAEFIHHKQHFLLGKVG